jgi:ribosomal protein L6P/L9E
MVNKNKIGNEILKELYLQKTVKNMLNVTKFTLAPNFQTFGYFITFGVFGTKIKKVNFSDSKKDSFGFEQNVKLLTKIKTMENSFFNKGFLMRLEVIGVGYKAVVKNSILSIRLGRVLEDVFIVPKNIFIFIVRSVHIYIFGIDKAEVSQTADKIRKLKFPDVFQGKGIRFYKEVLILKESKKKK